MADETIAMEHVRLVIADGIAEVALDRPKVNALSRALLAELRAVFQQLAADDAVRGALLVGRNGVFSAGLDLKEVAELDADNIGDFLDLMEEAFIAPFTFVKPLAAAVSGHAIAGGMILALCADYFAMGEGDYKIGLTELQVGVPFPRVAFETVRTAVPERALRKLVNDADTYAPAEIWKLGVGDALCADAEGEARAWLQKVTARPLETFAFGKAQRRREAWQRIARTSHAERRTLVAALLAGREQLAR